MGDPPASASSPGSEGSTRVCDAQGSGICSCASPTRGGERCSLHGSPESRSQTTFGNWKLTETQKEAAARLYEAGRSCSQVAEVYGVSRQAIWDILRRRTKMRPNLRYGPDNHFWRGGISAQDAAQNALEKAVKRGQVTRPERCEHCGETPLPFKDGRSAIQAHHTDYGRPLEVTWLCQRCHHNWHLWYFETGNWPNLRWEAMPLEASQGESISSAAASLSPARTSPSPDGVAASTATDPASSSSSPESLTLFDLDGYSSRTYPGSSPRTAVGTSESCLERWPTSGTAWAGGFSTAVSSECRSDAGGCSSSEPALTEILEPPQNVPERYSLSGRAASGILRRAEKRGRTLPGHLAAALASVAGLRTPSE